MHPAFQVGDKAVYPNRGVADVVALETRQVGGEEQAFYHLRVIGSGLKIIVPVSKAAENGMRALAASQDIDELFDLLRDHEVPSHRQTWNRRHRGFMEKIRTGSLFEVGEVYRDLSLLKQTKNLSHGEKQVLRTARELLVKELSVAREVSEAEVAQQLDALVKN